MIPKIIHYCWFGSAKMNPLALKCIASWKKYLPEYKLMLWNEDNFDLSSTQWTQEAYQAKKFAFVTDYVRLYALKEYGGIYMDTDVEVLKSLDSLLGAPAFSGFETDEMIPTGIMASEKNGFWVNQMIDYYKNRPFLRTDGTPEPITNVTIITEMMKQYGFVPNNQFQTCNGIFYLYPKDYFCPKDQVTLRINITNNTYCIHHFNGSWFSPYVKFKKKVRSLLPYPVYEFIKKFKK